ncbi:hypothetical protein PALB_160 [Pseudoalteromonas luteoviolacea B = ATCC 29581]|nr:hypothetical protein PALB_160 [Pseudoalteromonas luteoviolacea B = ATCC 29581]
MPVINMFRKEALRNQYKSNDLGRSLIKQPSIINRAILALLVVFALGLIWINLSQIQTSKIYTAHIAAESYFPIVHNKVLIIEQVLVKDGDEVKRNAPLFGASQFNHDGVLEKVTIRAQHNGFFFQQRLDKNLIEPLNPIGHIVSTDHADDLAIWIKKSRELTLSANQNITLINQNIKMSGIITMVIGSELNDQEQRIYVQLDRSHYKHLSPNSTFQVHIARQPEKVINLIKK